MYTYSDELFSDIHKDAFGFRPTACEIAAWNQMSQEEKQAKWDRMADLIDSAIAEDKADELVAVQEFELRALESGVSRDQYIAWVVAMYKGDRDCAEYRLGLPYNYLIQ